MKKYILGLLVLIIAVSCTSSNSSTPATVPFPFQGHWVGTYTGTKDNGSFDINVSSAGIVSGTATSIPFSQTYQLTGTVTASGVFASTFGTTSSGGTFNGQLNTSNTSSGTWTNNIPNPDINGNWTGTKQ